MNSFKKYLTIAAFSLLVLGLPAIASAQYRDRDDDYNNRGGYGNGGYGNGGYGNGGYGNNNYYGNIRNTVVSLKQRADSFENLTDRNRNRNNGGGWGNWGGGYSNDSLEDLADRFAKAADRLEDKYGRGRNLDNSADEARRVIDLGSQIDRMMYRSRSDYAVQNVWNEITNDLQIISNTYGFNYYGSRNNRNNQNNRNNRRNGSWRDRLPINLPF